MERDVNADSCEDERRYRDHDDGDHGHQRNHRLICARCYFASAE